MDFAEALKGNVVYLWNGWVHASETRRAVELNIECGGMKRLMEEAAAHYGDRPLLGVDRNLGRE